MAITWSKKSELLWSAAVPPFVLKITATGDGRFSWQVFKDGTVNPTGSGMATSLGAAKRVTEQLVQRSGLI